MNESVLVLEMFAKLRTVNEDTTTIEQGLTSSRVRAASWSNHKEPRNIAPMVRSDSRNSSEVGRGLASLRQRSIASCAQPRLGGLGTNTPGPGSLRSANCGACSMDESLEDSREEARDGAGDDSVEDT